LPKRGEKKEAATAFRGRPKLKVGSPNFGKKRKGYVLGAWTWQVSPLGRKKTSARLGGNNRKRRLTRLPGGDLFLGRRKGKELQEKSPS